MSQIVVVVEDFIGLAKGCAFYPKVIRKNGAFTFCRLRQG